ncbi:MAG TPA: SAM-dependent chlorinase/fluorinase [Anaerolineales bacterium]|nr:SAM-dependent chlorinase/fluorinase [Anaerolineales bacterium]
MPVITLMTDFGIKDGNVGVMKGVIWGINPSVQISDLSHMIQPQNISEASYILARSAPYFSNGTVHVVVVDPGVGTRRRPMAAQIGDWFYVGPDNGTITGLLERAQDSGWQTHFVELNRTQYWLPEVSSVFHGRDIFSPVAAHLANGVSLDELGVPFNDPVRLTVRSPKKIDGGLCGEVIHIDHFGNIASNIKVEHLGAALGMKENILVRLNGTEIRGLVNTFGDRNEADVVALMNSTGFLSVAVVNGNAAAALGVKTGDEILVTFSSE